MKQNDLNSWEEFEEEVKKLNAKTDELTASEQAPSATTSIIYRGQAKSIQKLESVLERKVKKDLTVKQYFKWMLHFWNCPASAYKKKWPDLEKQINGLDVKNIYLFPIVSANTSQIIQFMVHLRHHGFPSPLLDWTANRLIAAYFAFHDIHKDVERVAIYTFRNHTGYPSNMRKSSEPTAIEIGRNISGSERHKKQESAYTLCVQEDGSKSFVNANFTSLKKDINQSGFCIDSNDKDVDLDQVKNVTTKFTIPASERNKVLKKLQNQKTIINRCFLFGESEKNRLPVLGETEEHLLSDLWDSILVNEDIW